MLDNGLFEKIKELFLEKHDNGVYHYTSPIGFYGIIKSNRFRFKEITNFEDNQEFYYTLDVFREVLNETPDEDNYKKFKEIYLNYDFKEIIDPKAVFKIKNSIIYKYYVASFSTCYDDEYMWANYTKNQALDGYCLGISKDSFDINARPCSYKEKDFEQFLYDGKVLYDRNKLKKNLLQLFLDYNTEHIQIEKILEFYDILRFISIFSKRKNPFINEQEYRYVIVRTFDRKKQEKIGTYEKFYENTITPYIESKFYKEALHKICCSPYTKKKNQEFNIIELLNKYKYPTYKNISIEYSKVNIKNDIT